MNKSRVRGWLITEYKRAALMLPLLLKRAVIAVVAVILTAGMTAFCVGKYTRSGTEETSAPMRIGYVAEENPLTALAVAYVEQMESVRALCVLEPTTEEAGKALLEEGALAALVVLPEDIVNEILRGSNAPATLYLPNGARTNVTAGKIFEEFANAAVGMLGTAQAEIYAAEELRTRLRASLPEELVEERLQELYNGINRFNLRLFADRERLFQREKLSLTENNTYAVYYAGAVLTLYMLVSGLFIGPLCKRGRLWQRIAARRLGVSYFRQLWSRVMAMLPALALLGAIPFLALLWPPLRAQLSVAWRAEYAAAALALLLFTAAGLQLVYQLVDASQRAILVLGLLALFQGYMSGCMIPAVLLPQGVTAIGSRLPAAYMRRIFTLLFTGGTEGLWSAVCGLAVWSAVCFALTWAAMHVLGPEETAGREGKVTTVPFKNRLANTFSWILFKRLLHRKSLWVCLLAAAVLSAVVVRLEERTDTVIYAAVYDETGTYDEALTAYDGLVRFVVCDSEEAVRRTVLRDKAECGYILPEGIAEALIKGKANRAVTVYEDGDAVVSRLVDEVLFNILFKPASLQWFEDYMAENAGVDGLERGSMSAAVERQISADATFRFRIERLGTEQAREETRTAFPRPLVVVVSVALCGIQGAAQAVVDLREKRFYKRNGAVVFLIMVLQPMLLGAAVGALLLWMPL
ncbi:MAG: ABC transporter permease [Roseburia sp.]|nr:ABC transporter permease [Roseburia sp.]